MSGPQEVRSYTYMPEDHHEGWNDALRNIFYTFYKFFPDGKKHGKDSCDFATFEDGHYIMRLSEAIMKSGRENRWVKIEEVF